MSAFIVDGFTIPACDGHAPTPHTLHMGKVIVDDCDACQREVARGNLTTIRPQAGDRSPA